MMCGRRFPVIPRAEVERVLAAAREARALAPDRLFLAEDHGRRHPLLHGWNYPWNEVHSHEHPRLTRADLVRRWSSLSCFGHSEAPDL